MRLRQALNHTTRAVTPVHDDGLILAALICGLPGYLTFCLTIAIAAPVLGVLPICSTPGAIPRR